MNAIRLSLTRLKADPAWGMENVLWLCGIFLPLGMLLPRYAGIAAAGVRLALLLAALGCAAGCLGRVYGRAFCRSHGRRPGAGVWGRLALAWLCSAALPALAFGLLGLFRGVPPLGAEGFLYAALFPALAAALFVPVWQPKGGFLLCGKAWWLALRALYGPLLACALGAILLNALAFFLLRNGVLRDAVSALLAALQWAVALELCCWFGEERKAKA